jgi:hypothetical protein
MCSCYPTLVNQNWFSFEYTLSLKEVAAGAQHGATKVCGAALAARSGELQQLAGLCVAWGGCAWHLRLHVEEKRALRSTHIRLC